MDRVGKKETWGKEMSDDWKETRALFLLQQEARRVLNEKRHLISHTDAEGYFIRITKAPMVMDDLMQIIKELKSLSLRRAK